MITKFKLYEDLLSDILEETNIEKDIMRYFNRYGLADIDVPVNFSIDDDEFKFIIAFKSGYNYSTDNLPSLVKKNDDGYEEIMIGIPRYLGKKIYENILEFLENMTEQDRKKIKAKNKGNDFNL